MVQRNDLETVVRDMVAYDILSKPLSNLGDKAHRRRDKMAGEAAKLLSEGYTAERITAYTEFRDEERARTMREGISSFSEAYPRYGKILEGMIQDKRQQSNEYLVFGIQDGFKLGAEDYRRVMKDIGMTSREADAMYPHILDISDRLGKARENAIRDILL